MFATAISALLNIVLNIVLIPFWGENAAAFTTALSEGCSLAICYVKSCSVVDFRIDIRELGKVLVGSVFVFLFCLWIHRISISFVLTILISVGGSVLGYIGLQFLMKNRACMDAFALAKRKLSGMFH